MLNAWFATLASDAGGDASSWSEDNEDEESLDGADEVAKMPRLSRRVGRPPSRDTNTCQVRHKDMSAWLK